jgi:voltage-gated sodium channel
MADFCRRIANGSWFHRLVLGLILFNASMMGLETWRELLSRWSTLFDAAHTVVQVAFVLELAVRIAAHGNKPFDFFKDGWNVFDFGVVALSLLPTAGPFATVARLARVLRVGRMVSGMPQLRLIIGTMLRSIPSMGHVVMLLGLLIYVYGVVGHHLFGRVDPAHWGNLGSAAHTLFVVITLEGWVEIMQTSSEATRWAWVYYASFIVVAVFVVTNLFIAVVINNLEEVRKEEFSASSTAASANAPSDELERLTAKVDELRAAVQALRPRV